MNYEHWERFALPETQYFETEHWLGVVRRKQVTLGSSVLLLKRPTPTLSSLTAEEAVDFVSAAGEFEQRALAAFGAEKFNYLAAMMKDPFLHFHAFPRYSAPVTFAGRDWRDEMWPRAIELRDIDTDEATRDTIRLALAEASLP